MRRFTIPWFFLAGLLFATAGCTFNNIHRPIVPAVVPSADLQSDPCRWDGDWAARVRWEEEIQKFRQARGQQLLSDEAWPASSPDEEVEEPKNPNRYEGNQRIGPRMLDRSSEDRCSKRSMEVTSQYTLFFVEFDEQGRLYDDRQFKALFDYLELQLGCKEKDLSIVTFVHGWRHNSSAGDSNVNLARQILSYTHQQEQTGSSTNGPLAGRNKVPCPFPGEKTADRQDATGEPQPREVVGIYVGWRGKSLTGMNVPIINNWELLSVWDRKNTAANVAVGSVRELFGRLRVLQQLANLGESRCKKADSLFLCKRVRLLIVGHSFGGLLVFNAVSPSLIDSLGSTTYASTRRKDGVGAADECQEELPDVANKSDSQQSNGTGLQQSALVRSFADLVILINPAIEGARFEALHQAVDRRVRSSPETLKNPEKAFCPNQKPALVIITATNDIATRYAFRVSRFFNTFFESASPGGTRDDTSADPGEIEDSGRKMDRPTFEALRRQEELDASVNTIGHVRRFHTHVARTAPVEKDASKDFTSDYEDYCNKELPSGDTHERLLRLCRCGAEPGGMTWFGYVDSAYRKGKRSCPAYIEEANAAETMLTDRLQRLPDGWLRSQRESTQHTQRSQDGAILYTRSGWRQAYCGGPVLTHIESYQPTRLFEEMGREVPPEVITRHPPNSPIWVIKSDDKALINNHSGIEELAFKSFVQQLYHLITVRTFDRNGFEALHSKAKKQMETMGCAADLSEKTPQGH